MLKKSTKKIMLLAICLALIALPAMYVLAQIDDDGIPWGDPLPEGEPIDPLPEGEPVDPLPEGEPVDPLPEGEPVDPLPEGEPVDPLPEGEPIDPLPEGEPVDPLPEGEPVPLDDLADNEAPFWMPPMTPPEGVETMGCCVVSLIEGVFVNLIPNGLNGTFISKQESELCGNMPLLISSHIGDDDYTTGVFTFNLDCVDQGLVAAELVFCYSIEPDDVDTTTRFEIAVCPTPTFSMFMELSAEETQTVIDISSFYGFDSYELTIPAGETFGVGSIKTINSTVLADRLKSIKTIWCAGNFFILIYPLSDPAADGNIKCAIDDVHIRYWYDEVAP